MRFVAVLLLTLALLAGILTVVPPSPGRAQAPVVYAVTLGQSNGTGQGDPTVLTQVVDPNVHAFVGARRDAGTVQWVGGQWQLAAEPIAGEGYGFSTDFGKALVASGLASEAWLVNCAVDGSSITLWYPGAPLYQACLQLLARLNVTPSVVLMYQGEADANPSMYGAWPYYATWMVSGLRQTYGQDLPLVYAQIGKNAGADLWWFLFQDRQASIRLPGVAMVSTYDLDAIPPEHVHLTAASERALGQRMARQYARLLKEGG